MSEYNKLYRSRDERMLAGVCGGLGEYFNIDPTLVRLAFVLGVIFTYSGLFWVYIILMIVIPEEVPPSEDVITTRSRDVDSGQE